MISSVRRMLAIFIVVSSLPRLLMTQQNAPPAPAATPTPALCAFSPETAQYVLTASNGTPVPTTKHFSFTLKNDKEILIRLQDINPYSFKCSVSTSTTPFKETAIATFLGLVGGVTGNLGVTTPSPGATPTPAPSPAPTVTSGGHGFKAVRPTAVATPTPCVEQYKGKHAQVLSLQDFRDSINRALEDTRTSQDQTLLDFSRRVADLRSQSSCSAIVTEANNMAALNGFSIAPVTVPPDPAVAGATPTPTPMGQAIDELSRRAQKLLTTLKDELSSDANGDCKKQLQTTIDQDSSFLSALVNSSGSTPSAVTTWNNQLKAFNTVLSNMKTAQSSIIAVLGNRQNFAIDTSIHGNQATVTYTATCTPVPAPIIPAPDAQTGATPPAPTPTPAPSNSWSHDFKFGVGPRFVIAGGLVVSPLQQITFSTTATPGGSGTTANTIIQQQNSSTRILPIAMLHGRYWDELPRKKLKDLHWLPNYLSAGVTAKSSDTKGTSIEYLLGPSWAFADRQLFFTTGAYAGQQQRLANVGNPPLTVGSTTSLSSANLPITQTTVWKLGFAITWAPGGK